MANTERKQPAATRSPSEIEFVLRHAKRKSGPAVLRDLARAGDDRSEVRVDRFRTSGRPSATDSRRER